MNVLKVITIAVCWMTTICTARSRYVAIPIEDVRFVEMSEDLVRLPRKAPVLSYYQGDSSRPLDTTQLTQESRNERQASGGHNHDYVDYGAHSGHHGSFGWYADFPVHKGS